MQQFQWFITPRHLPDNFIERQKAQYVIIYSFILLIITTINITLVALTQYVNTFTLLAWVTSVIIYLLARYINYRFVAGLLISSVFAMPYILLAINPSSLPILTLLFLVTISLLMASVFLSLRSTIFIAIIALISNFILNNSAYVDTSIPVLSILVPSLIIIFLLVLNSYAQERLATRIEQGNHPRDPQFYDYALALMTEPTVVHVGVKIVAVNTAASLLLGQAKEQLIGRDITDYTIANDSNVYETDIHAEQLTVHYQGTLKQSDNKQALTITARSITYADTLATLMTLRPIETQAIELLDDTEHVFADDNEKIFQHFAYNLADYAYSISVGEDKSQTIDWIIGETDTIIGRSETELLNISAWSTLIYPDDIPFYDLRHRALLRGEIRTLEYRIIHTDGTIRWMQDTAYPIVNMQTGSVYRIMSAVNDISNRIQSQEILKTHVVQQAVVAELGLLALKTTDHQEIMQHVTILCEQVLHNGFVAIFEHDETNYQLNCINVSRPGLPIQLNEKLVDAPSQSLASYTLHAQESVISNELASEKRFTPHPGILAEQYASGVGINILGKNSTFGILTVYSKSKQNFGHDEVYFLQSIANVLGTFIERNRAQLAERDQAEFADALSHATAAINSNLELHDVLSKIMTYVKQVIPQTQQASIMLLNEETRRYYHYTTWGFEEELLKAQLNEGISIEKFPLFVKMAQTREPIYVPDVKEDQRWVALNAVSKTRSYLGAPIIADGDIIGFISVHAHTIHAFNKIFLQRLKALSETTSTAIVNARKQEYLETQITHRTAELEQQSNRISTILEGTADGIFYTEDDRIAFVNDTLCQLTGYSASEMIFQSSAIFQPDDMTHAEREKLEGISDRVMEGDVWRDTVRLQRKNGEMFEAGLTVSLIESPDDILRSVTIVRDMSKEAEIEKLKRILIASAAHDLRSPIMSLQLRMHMIKNQPQNMDYHMERLDYIIERMNNLVSDLLDTHGRIVLTKQTIILQNILDQVVDILALESETKGIKFIYNTAIDPYTLLADKHRLEQVFFNLITNAINYTDAGGQITVSYRIAENQQMIMIDIEDTGVGIPEDELPNIFLPFYRTKDNDRKGNGLGLSITHEVVTLHDGTITVKSEYGKGSTFTVALPLHILKTD